MVESESKIFGGHSQGSHLIPLKPQLHGLLDKETKTYPRAREGNDASKKLPRHKTKLERAPHGAIVVTPLLLPLPLLMTSEKQESHSWRDFTHMR